MKQANSVPLKLSTGTGLKFWLFFLFCFFFLGYSVPLSIMFGAIGGWGSALLVGWWKTNDDDSELPPPPETPEPYEDIEDAPTPVKVRGLRSAHQRNTRARNRSQPLAVPFRRFFDKSNSDKKSR